jgi:hypothetical protein
MLILRNKKILAIIMALIFILPNICFGGLELNLDYPEFGGFKLSKDTDINEVVAWLYYFIISISGLSCFIMIVRGGFMWMSSAGNINTLNEAKDIISSAILGLIIVLTSFLILQVINPELTTLKIEPL